MGLIVAIVIGIVVFIVLRKLVNAVNLLLQARRYLLENHPKYAFFGRWLWTALGLTPLAFTIHAYFGLALLPVVFWLYVRRKKEEELIPIEVLAKQREGWGTIFSFLLAVGLLGVRFGIRQGLSSLASSEGGTNVSGHEREGTWVDPYAKADGTQVRGHHRSGSWVDSHYRG